MALWAVLTLMCCATCVALSIPLIRVYEAAARRKSEAIAIYQEQLKEAERELESGTATQRETTSTKADIQRRIIAAHRSAATAQPVSPRWRMIGLASITSLIALGSVNLYMMLGQPELVAQQTDTSQNSLMPSSGASAPEGSPEQLIEKLKARLESNPKDAVGWRTLGWSYFNTGKYTESAQAYGRASSLEPGNLDLQSAYAEALVQAAGGTVTPEAGKIFSQVLGSNPQDARARYYAALALEQAGSAKQALEAWISLLKDAPADAGWRTDVRSHVEALGKQTGSDVAAALDSSPPASAGSGGSAPVISQDDVNAVTSLPQDDQQAMIRGMVDKLAERLKSQPNDPEGWKRLMRARTVLGEQSAAQAAFQDALKVFGNNLEIQKSLKDAASEYGITQD